MPILYTRGIRKIRALTCIWDSKGNASLETVLKAIESDGK